MSRTVAIGLLLVGLCLVALPAPATAQPEPRTGGRVNGLKVLSDRTDDVTTIENIITSFARPGMTDQERSKALWTAVLRYRHQTVPPNEHLAGDWEAHDPVKIMNVYGYCMCCCTSALVEALNRADGREARGRILNGHSVPEVRYGDAWHMFDASLMTYFPDPKSGVAASVDDIAAAVAAWYGEHPEYRKNPGKLAQLMRSDDWTGWTSKGPELLANCPFYTMGYLPARTHGWDATMVEYDRKSEVYEYGYQVGHRALFSLRPGESIVREAGNRGLHVNGESMPAWDVLRARAPEADLVYLNDLLPGYRGGVVGNGTQRYAPDLLTGDLAGGCEVFENLACGRDCGLHVEMPGKPGVAIVPMSSPYVYLGGSLEVEAFRKSTADRVALSLSTNNGRTFTPIWSAEGTGRSTARIDISRRVLRRYAYWLRIDVESASPRGTGLRRLAIVNDFQHAPRTLTWLAPGRNAITVAGDLDPGLATRTVACKITSESDTAGARNETIHGMGVAVDNLRIENDACWWKGGTGTMTVPIEVPGNLVALRFCAHVRARGARDLVRMVVSVDDGKTWREAGRIAGPTPATTRSFRFDDWPAATRKTWLRFELTGNNTIGVFSFRVDADYRDPLASPKLEPFRVVHRWSEGGQPRTHTERVERLPFTYEIAAGERPEMTSVSYEMPASH